VENAVATFKISDMGFCGGEVIYPCGHQKYPDRFPSYIEMMDLSNKVSHNKDGDPYLPGTHTCSNCQTQYKDPVVDWRCAATPHGGTIERFSKKKKTRLGSLAVRIKALVGSPT
jgi:hypothetical protein